MTDPPAASSDWFVRLPGCFMYWPRPRHCRRGGRWDHVAVGWVRTLMRGQSPSLCSQQLSRAASPLNPLNPTLQPPCAALHSVGDWIKFSSWDAGAANVFPHFLVKILTGNDAVGMTPSSGTTCNPSHSGPNPTFLLRLPYSLSL